MSAYGEERLAELLRALRPAPDAWVRAAQGLAPARSALDDVVARVRADAAFRHALFADLEAALAAAGYEPEPGLVEALRRRFDVS